MLGGWWGMELQAKVKCIMKVGHAKNSKTKLGRAVLAP